MYDNNITFINEKDYYEFLKFIPSDKDLSLELLWEDSEFVVKKSRDDNYLVNFVSKNNIEGFLDLFHLNNPKIIFKFEYKKVGDIKEYSILYSPNDTPKEMNSNLYGTNAIEMTKQKDEVKSKDIIKIFISQPMSGLTDVEIMTFRQKVINNINSNPNAMFIYNKLYGSQDLFFKNCNFGHPFEVIDNIRFFDKDNMPNKFEIIAMDIRDMKDADILVVAGDWTNHRGCQLEIAAAKLYGLPILILDNPLADIELKINAVSKYDQYKTIPNRVFNQDIFDEYDDFDEDE